MVGYKQMEPRMKETSCYRETEVSQKAMMKQVVAGMIHR